MKSIRTTVTTTTLTEIYKQLRKNAHGKVTYFRSDWRVDRKILTHMFESFNKKETTTTEFIHVSTSTGTHLFPVYRDKLDINRKYLFGYCTPRSTLIDFASIFRANSSTLSANKIIQHYNGRTLSLITQVDAYQIFLNASQSPRNSLI